MIDSLALRTVRGRDIAVGEMAELLIQRPAGMQFDMAGAGEAGHGENIAVIDAGALAGLAALGDANPVARRQRQFLLAIDGEAFGLLQVDLLPLSLRTPGGNAM